MPDSPTSAPKKPVRYDLSAWFRLTPPVVALQRRLQDGARALLVEGMVPSASILLAAALSQNRSLLFLVGSQEAAERAADALAAFIEPGHPWFLIGHSPAFLEDGGNPATSAAVADRLCALDCLSRSQACLLIATLPGLLQHTYAPDAIRTAVLRFAPGDSINLDAVLRHLVSVGYERAEVVQQAGEFAARGGILDIFPSGAAAPIRIDLFGDEVETVRSFNPVTQRSTGALRSARVLPAGEPLHHTPGDSSPPATLLDYLPGDTLVVVDDASAIHRRWDEFKLEAEEELRAMLAGHELEEETPGRSLPFLSLSDALPRLEPLQSLFLNPLSHTAPWGRPEGSLSLTCEPAPHLDGDTEALAARTQAWRERGVATWIFSSQWPRLVELLRAQGIEAIAIEGARHPGADRHGEDDGDSNEGASPRPLSSSPTSAPAVFVGPGGLAEGFFIPSARLVALSDGEIFGGVKMRRPARRFQDSAPLASLLDLKQGDMIVHVDHGIGVFRGLRSMEVEGVQRDYLHLEYAQGDKLFVPSDQINRVQRYIGSEDHAPTIHRLGGQDWVRTKRRVRDQVEIMAKELVALYAARSTRDGHAYSPDTPWQGEMEQSFVYQETPDQLRAIEDVKSDLESDKPMDRLICGDVGYGKTEVAIRAAFKVVMEGKQVAVLVPTTVLAQQHFNTFTERLSGFPVKIEMLSRFRSRKEQTAIVEGLKEGRLDIVIGTHRLLSKDVGFKELGMVVVDEEQRFGVAHKEKLKQLRRMVDVLTLTATPIPRTLHMAMSTIRDMSVMNQAPEGRTPIRTVLREASDEIVQHAVLRELERDGQVYFVHNRIEDLLSVTEKIRRLAPQARVGTAHGQMPEQQLEQVMLDFYERRYDVLVCTTIIESGLDIPNVNTIIVDRADRLGLAQLYQLRGRVGRSNRQAYCYLLFEPDREISEVAQKRLDALREFTDLGSGFRIAMRDLEIRGAGNLLGAEQSGAMMSVGFDLYCQMIADAVRTLKNEDPPPPPPPPVDLPIQAFIPSTYLPAESLRIEFYKRLSAPGSLDEIVAVQEELQDRFGQLPAPVRNMIAILRFRLQCREIGVSSISGEKEQVVFRLGPRLRPNPAQAASLQHKHRGARFLPDRILLPIGARGVLGPVNELLDSLALIRARKPAKPEALIGGKP